MAAWHVKAQPITIDKLGPGGVVKRHERLGGVYAPVKGKGQRPVYIVGPTGGKAGKDPLVLYQCPVSAIPLGIWDLLHVWHGARLMNALPFPGGFLDQPEVVRRAFPVFEALMRGQEQTRASQTTANLVAAGLAGVFGGGRP